MDIARLPFGATTAISPTPKAAATHAFQRWSSSYQADHQQLQNKLENIQKLHKMDNVEILQLQAMTQRFSLHTEVAARMADRLQNATRQLLSQGG